MSMLALLLACLKQRGRLCVIPCAVRRGRIGSFTLFTLPYWSCSNEHHLRAEKQVQEGYSCVTRGCTCYTPPDFLHIILAARSSRLSRVCVCIALFRIGSWQRWSKQDLETNTRRSLHEALTCSQSPAWCIAWYMRAGEAATPSLLCGKPDTYEATVGLRNNLARLDHASGPLQGLAVVWASAAAAKVDQACLGSGSGSTRAKLCSRS